MSKESAKQHDPESEAEYDPAALAKPKGDGEEKRNDPRTRVVQIGKLQIDGRIVDCFIVDLSRKGTRLRTLEPLECDLSGVKLHIEDIGTLEAEVRWIDGMDIGLKLIGEIEAPDDYESANIEDVLRVQDRY